MWQEGNPEVKRHINRDCLKVRSTSPLERHYLYHLGMLENFSGKRREVSHFYYFRMSSGKRMSPPLLFENVNKFASVGVLISIIPESCVHTNISEKIALQHLAFYCLDTFYCVEICERFMVNCLSTLGPCWSILAGNGNSL